MEWWGWILAGEKFRFKNGSFELMAQAVSLPTLQSAKGGAPRSGVSSGDQRLGQPASISRTSSSGNSLPEPDYQNLDSFKADPARQAAPTRPNSALPRRPKSPSSHPFPATCKFSKRRLPEVCRQQRNGHLRFRTCYLISKSDPSTAGTRHAGCCGHLGEKFCR